MPKLIIIKGDHLMLSNKHNSAATNVSDVEQVEYCNKAPSVLFLSSNQEELILFYLFYSYPQHSSGTPHNLGREPLGFLSPVVALVTIYRKGDETQHASKG